MAAKLSLNFVARANTGPLVTSLHQVRAAAATSMAGVQTSAIKVQAPLNTLNKQIQSGRLSWGQFTNTLRSSSRIIAENNALLRSTARSFIDASGNAQVYLNVIRGTAATQATLNQRLMLGVTAARAFGRQMIATGKNVQWAGRQVMIGLSLPLVMLATLSAKGAEEFDKQMTRMVKVTNLSAVRMRNEMGDMVETYQVGSKNMGLAISSIERQADRLVGIGADMGFVAGETSKLAAEFSQMGFAGVQLDALTTSTLRLSRVSGADLTDAMNVTRLAAMSFGKELGDGPGSLTDTFARLNMIENRTSLSLNEMAGAIPIVASVAKNLGIEIETLGGMLALMKDKGIAAREGATSLRTGLIRLVQDATDPAIAAFEKLGINIVELQNINRGNVFGLMNDLAQLLDKVKNSGDDAAQQTELFIAAIGKMVGTRAAARFTSMLEGMGSDLETYTEIVNGVEVTQFRFVEGVDETSDAFRALSPALMDSNKALKQFEFEEQRVNESLAGTAEILRAQLNLELARLGRLLLPIKNRMMEFARDLIRSFNNLSERTRAIVISIATLVAILGPATMVFGVFLNALGQVIGLFTRLYPSLRLTTVALEAEKKAFDRNTIAINTTTASKQAMIQTNGSLSASAASVTAAVQAQAGAYAALGAAMAGIATRGAAAGAFGGPVSSAVSINKATAGTRRVRRTLDPKTGKPTSKAAGTYFDPQSKQYRDASGSFTSGPASAAAFAGLSIAQVMAMPRSQRFNPTMGMQTGHEAAIRNMLTNEFLMSQMRSGADPAALGARPKGGMAPIDAIRYHAVREATASYELAAAQAASTKGQKIPTIEEHMKKIANQRFVDSAVLRAATEGVVVPDQSPKAAPGSMRTAFAVQPQSIREMTGLSQRMDSRDIVRLTRAQRASFQSQFGASVGGRSSIGQIEQQVRSARGSTTAMQARMALENMVETGEVKATRRAMTKDDIIRQDRATVARTIQSEIATGQLQDTREAREARRQELLPDRARGGREGRAAMRKDRARGARETFMGRRPPQTGLEQGIMSGRNAALAAMILPFKLIGKALMMTTKSLFGIIPAIKLISGVITASTVPALYVVGNVLKLLTGAFYTLIAATFRVATAFAANQFGRARQAIGSSIARQSARRNLDRAGRRVSTGAPLSSPRGPIFIPRSLRGAASRGAAGGRGMMGAAGRGLAVAGRGVGGGILSALGAVPFIGAGTKAARAGLASVRATGGVRAGVTQSVKGSTMAEGFRRGRDASILQQTGTINKRTAGRLARGDLAGTGRAQTYARQAGHATPYVGRAGKARAALGGARGAAMAMSGMKGGLANFALGSVGGAAATVAIPIALTLGSAAIANPEQFKKAMSEIFGPTLQTIKKLWDSVSDAFNRLAQVIRGTGEESDGMGGKLSRWAGIISGLIGGTLGGVLTIVLGLVRSLFDALTGIFLWLKGDGEGAANAFGTAWRSVFGSIMEAFANFFGMLEDIPVIGKLFGGLSGMFRDAANQTNKTLAAMSLIPDEVAKITKQQRLLNGMMEENKSAMDDIGIIVKDLVDFDILEQSEVDRLIDMAKITEGMTDDQVAQKEKNLSLVYDELVAMEYLTDEQITQIGALVKREQLQGLMQRKQAELQNLNNILRETESTTSGSIVNSRAAELRLATLTAAIEAELAKDVKDRDQLLLASAEAERESIVRSNNQRVTAAGLTDERARREAEIEEINERMLSINDEINRQLSNRKQRIENARQATQEETEELENLQDQADKATRSVQALQSAMGEVMGDVDKVLNNIISKQSDFVGDFFSSLAEAAEEYFNNFEEMFDQQTELALEAVEERADAEMDLIDQIADASIQKIEDEIAAENELEKKREDFFRKEKARLSFLESRRIGEIKIQEEILRGNLGEAGILEIQQRSMSQNFYSDIVQERESELKEMRNSARQAMMDDLELERNILKQEVEQEEQAMKDSISLSREFAKEEARLSSGSTADLIKNAEDASKKVLELEEQRIENYIREWSRVTPASEEELASHIKSLNDFIDESGRRAQQEIDVIRAGLVRSLGVVEGDFSSSVNSVSSDLSQMLGSSRFAVEGFIDAVKIGSSQGLGAMLSMVEGFSGGLREGFISGQNLVKEFARVFEREITTAFDYARDVATRIMSEEDKWAAAGEAAARAYNEAFKSLQADIGQKGTSFSRGAGTFDMFDSEWQDLKDFQKEWEGRSDELGRTINRQYERALAAQSSGYSGSVPPIMLNPNPPSGQTPARRDDPMGRLIFDSPLQKMMDFKESVRRPVVSSFDPMDHIDPNDQSMTPFNPHGGWDPTTMHTGGVVGKLSRDEVPAILQTGEYVIQKSAVSSVGTRLLDSINNSSATFSPPAQRSLSMGNTQPSASTENVYHLNFNIDGGNIDENKLAQKVVFEIKKMDRSSGGGRRMPV